MRWPKESSITSKSAASNLSSLGAVEMYITRRSALSYSSVTEPSRCKRIVWIPAPRIPKADELVRLLTVRRSPSAWQMAEKKSNYSGIRLSFSGRFSRSQILVCNNILSLRMLPVTTVLFGRFIPEGWYLERSESG